MYTFQQDRLASQVAEVAKTCLRNRVSSNRYLLSVPKSGPYVVERVAMENSKKYLLYIVSKKSATAPCKHKSVLEDVSLDQCNIIVKVVIIIIMLGNIWPIIKGIMLNM